MLRPSPLVPGVLVRRYCRFLADVTLSDGRAVTAHCANTGAMEGLTRPGTPVWLSLASNPDRKLPFTWELAELEGLAIGVNTSAPNRSVAELLRRDALPAFAGADEIRAEVPYADGRRVDFWLRRGDRQLYLEVKNCHLVYGDRRAYFPDCVSDRAAHHVKALAAVVGPTVEAHVLFVVQVPSARSVRPSDIHDPVFASAARLAGRAGVRFAAITLRQDFQEVVVEREIRVDLAPYRSELATRSRGILVKAKSEFVAKTPTKSPLASSLVTAPKNRATKNGPKTG